MAMRAMRWMALAAAVGAGIVRGGAAAGQAGADAPAGAAAEAAEAAEPAGRLTLPAEPAEMPGIRVDAAKGVMELDAVVVQREGMLELVVTTRGGKEHEAVFAAEARADHVHLGLLMLGLKPGTTGAWAYENNVPKPINPTGDRVAISVVTKGEDGAEVETAVGRFVLNRVTGEEMGASEFVFAGGRVNEKMEGPWRYMANGTGDLVTLVSFPERDEVLAWPEAASDENDSVVWVANKQVVPAVGTEVVLRVRAVKGEGKG